MADCPKCGKKNGGTTSIDKGLSGAAAGAAAGAAIGSAVPIIGNAIGAGVGAFLGLVSGGSKYTCKYCSHQWEE